MIKKNVLIVSYTYPPSNAPAAQRPYAIAKFLDKQKFNVTVLTCGNADSSMGFDASFNPELPDVTLIKVATLFGNKTADLRKHKTVAANASLKTKIKSKIFNLGTSMLVPDKAIFWLPNVKRFLKFNNSIITDTDIVFTTSPMFTNHLIGRYINRRNKDIIWAADFRDFHFLENISYLKGIKRYLNKRLEENILRNATIVLFISNAMKDIYATHYQDLNPKMKVLYNGFDLEDFKDLNISPVKNNKLTIFYAGSFYGGVRSPVPLFNLLDTVFLRGILEVKDVEVVIAGTLEETLEEELRGYTSYKCLNFIGRVPRSEVLSRLTTSTLLWLIVGEKVTHYTGVPIKFYEYMAARRPVINFAPHKSEPTKIISENNLGWSIDVAVNNIEDQVAIFSEIANAFKSGKLDRSLSPELLDKYSRKHQTNIFETIIDV
ncbi:MAG: glycosyltransferase [Patiriisocius sp.]|uniref:glycosyltransferase n=1 Tax=Patiriisocius sp. TaxID=2822396 RepID=UPI003EF72F17